MGNWERPRPDWIPEGYLGVVGEVVIGETESEYSRDFPGMLTGGNSVIRRPLLDRVGLYNTQLGRTAVGLLSCEDQDMYDRLLIAEAKGRYLPDLRVYHRIPAERLTKRYFRSWCFWNGVSRGILDRQHREPVKYLLGIPRYQLGQFFLGLRTASLFHSELRLWSLLGFARGKWFGK